MSQAVTDRERAKIALSYRCASLTDVFWVRHAGEYVSFGDMNLYENHLDRTFIDIALKGRQYSVQNEYLARDLATNGCFPKAWRRTDSGFQLLKGGANCQTAFGEVMTQREAAVQAVKEIGLNQHKEAGEELFAGLPQYYDMFLRRLELLGNAEKNVSNRYKGG